MHDAIKTRRAVRINVQARLDSAVDQMEGSDQVHLRVPAVVPWGRSPVTR